MLTSLGTYDVVSRAHTMLKISNTIMPYAEQVTVMSRPMGQIGLLHTRAPPPGAASPFSAPSRVRRINNVTARAHAHVHACTYIQRLLSLPTFRGQMPLSVLCLRASVRRGGCCSGRKGKEFRAPDPLMQGTWGGQMAHNSVLEIPPPVGQSGLCACTETGHRLDVRG